MTKNTAQRQSLGTWECTHKIQIPSAVHEADYLQIEKYLKELDGIISIKTIPKRKAIKVRYDQLLTNFDAILEKLNEIGFPPSNSWWNRKKALWFQSLDSNARINANLPPPPCCSNPRGITRSKKR